MIKTREFYNTFIPDRPWANPYFGLEAYTGTDVSAQEHFEAWQLKHPTYRIVSVTKANGDRLLVAYEVPSEEVAG